MRGTDIFQESLSTIVQLESFGPADHPLRPIKALVDEAMKKFNWLKNLAVALNLDYQLRFQKTSDHKLTFVIHAISGFEYGNRGLTMFAQAIPKQYKIAGDDFERYQLAPYTPH